LKNLRGRLEKKTDPLPGEGATKPTPEKKDELSPTKIHPKERKKINSQTDDQEKQAKASRKKPATTPEKKGGSQGLKGYPPKKPWRPQNTKEFRLKNPPIKPPSIQAKKISQGKNSGSPHQTRPIT